MQTQVAGTKVAMALPPNRSNALPDMPAWVNTWTLQSVDPWGGHRVEKYTVTSQLFVRDADINNGLQTATDMVGAFIELWDSPYNALQLQTFSLELVGREPSVALLEQSGQSYPGAQVVIQIGLAADDVPFDDPLLSPYRAWRPAPDYYWHYVNLPTPVTDEFPSFRFTYYDATIAARVVASSSTERIAKSRDLVRDIWTQGPLLADGSYVTINGIQAWPIADPAADGQVQVDVRFVLDDSYPTPPADGLPLLAAYLTWRQDEPVGIGPTIVVTPEGVHGDDRTTT
jgi:hypothetical protein